MVKPAEAKGAVEKKAGMGRVYYVHSSFLNGAAGPLF